MADNRPAAAAGARARLRHPSSLDDVVQLLSECRRVLVLTGAGVSTACGIPDFRSKTTGLYAMIAAAGIDGVNEPEEVFDIRVFREEPEVFYSVAPHLLGKLNVPPSDAHRFLGALEARGKLLRNITQNVDGEGGVTGLVSVCLCVCVSVCLGRVAPGTVCVCCECVSFCYTCSVAVCVALSLAVSVSS